MKRIRLIIAALVFFAIAGLGFAKEVERPDWVDNWRTIYSDTRRTGIHENISL